MSTNQQPQTDWNYEILNWVLKNYLLSHFNGRQNDWDDLLSTAEFAYNTLKTEGMDETSLEIACNIFGSISGNKNHLSSSTRVTELRKLFTGSYEDAMFAHHLEKARFAFNLSANYKAPVCRLGDHVWLSKDCFTDALSETEKRRRFSVNKCSAFKVMELIGKHAIKLELPNNVQCHPVLRVEHTGPLHEQRLDIGHLAEPRLDSVPDKEKTELGEIERSLQHRWQGKGCEWLALPRGARQREGTWACTRDFVDDYSEEVVLWVHCWAELVTNHSLAGYSMGWGGQWCSDSLS